jgi:hypothetical protein
MVEEALGVPKKGEFARSFNDKVRVLKIQMGSNRVGCFLEAVVFVEGGRKGVIRLLEGRGGWGWRRFVEERCPMSAHLVAKVLLAIGNTGAGGSPPSYAEVLAAPLGGLKSAYGEALVFDLGRWFSTSGATCLTELLRSLAMEFLAKMRAEVDQILFFGLGLKLNASRDVRKRLGQVLSWLGLKHKLIFGRRQTKRKASGLVLRPKSLVFNSQVKPVERFQELSGQGESSSKKTPEGSVIEPVAAPLGKTSPVKSWFQRGFLRPGFSWSHEEVAVLSSRPAKSSSTGKSPLEESLPSSIVVSSLEFALASPVMSLTSTETIALASPVVPSMILAALEVAQSSSTMIDAGFVL